MVTIIQGDCREKLRELKDKSVHCIVTSPPYYGLRNYDVDNQIGVEQTPEIYIQNLVEIFREARRVLRDDGMVWLNLGDSYASNGGDLSKPRQINTGQSIANSSMKPGSRVAPNGFKPKDLLGIPWRVALSLQADGWYLRSDAIEKVELYCPCGCGYTLEERIWRYSQDREIIWDKPNPMPESMTDRPTKSHEYIFLLSKSARYFYDAEAIKEKQTQSSFERAKYGWNGRTDDNSNGARTGSSFKRMAESGEKILTIPKDGYRNKRSVWTVATTRYAGAHYATYPPELISPCIQAGTSEHGCCPKCGAPWERMIEKTDAVNTSAKGSRFDKGKTAVNGNGRTQEGDRFLNRTTGWQSTCTCQERLNKQAIEATTKLETGIILPPELAPIPCTVLDPFAGSGTTGQVCETLGRNSILIELNPQYIELIRQRTGQKGLFAS